MSYLVRSLATFAPPCAAVVLAADVARLRKMASCHWTVYRNDPVSYRYENDIRSMCGVKPDAGFYYFLFYIAQLSYFIL